MMGGPMGMGMGMGMMGPGSEWAVYGAMLVVDGRCVCVCVCACVRARAP